MGFPDHLILDFNFKKNTNLLPYWVLKFTNSKHKNPLFIEEISLNKLNNSVKTKYDWVSFLRDRNYASTQNCTYQKTLTLFTKSSIKDDNTQSFKKNYLVENLVNTNFLRYERLYTKLKYSRSPAFDIVSGGAAALLAGFIGFLISEKFGFELVDSGDFYYLFMYCVFGAFILKPLLYISNTNNSILKTLSYLNFIHFFNKLLFITIHTIKTIFK